MLGIDVERLIPPAEQKDQPDDYELEPECWLAWQVFLRCGSQWRKCIAPGLLHFEGLDYSGVEIVMRRVVRVPRDEQDEVFAQLQILEDEARLILNEPRS